MTNEPRAAYSQFRLEFDAYLNSEIQIDEAKEDQYFAPAEHVNYIFTTGHLNIVTDEDERRFMVHTFL